MSSVVHCVCCRSGAHVAVKMYHRDRMKSMNVKQARTASERCTRAFWRGGVCMRLQIKHRRCNPERVTHGLQGALARQFMTVGDELG